MPEEDTPREETCATPTDDLGRAVLAVIKMREAKEAVKAAEAALLAADSSRLLAAPHWLDDAWMTIDHAHNDIVAEIELIEGEIAEARELNMAEDLADWAACDEHETTYPQGGVCPDCYGKGSPYGAIE